MRCEKCVGELVIHQLLGKWKLVCKKCKSIRIVYKLSKEKEICTYCFNEIRFEDETWLKLNFICPKDKILTESYYCDLTCLSKEIKKVKEEVDDMCKSKL